MNNKNPISSGVIILVSFFLLLFVYTKFFGPISFSINSVNTNKSDTFMVAGEGKVSVKPDIATINVGVQANAGTVKNAQEQMNVTINKVTSALKRIGIDEKDIRTTNYNINPMIDWNNGKQRITGYNATTNLSVKVKNLDLVNQVIDEATKNGANDVGGINFSVDDKTKAENEARELAVKKAKEKAATAAQIAGFKLGRIVNYNEGVSNQPPILYAERALKSMGGAANDSTEVQPGASEIVINVTLSYEIR